MRCSTRRSRMRWRRSTARAPKAGPRLPRRAEPPFSKGTLVGFRRRLIAHDLDRRLIERTVELADAARRVRLAPAAGGARQQPAVGGGAGRGHLQPLGPRPAQGAGRDRPSAGAGAGGRWRARPGPRLVGRVEPEGGPRPRLGRPGRAGAGAGPGAGRARRGRGAGWRPSRRPAPTRRCRPAWPPPTRCARRTWRTAPTGRRRCARGWPRDRRISVEDGEMRHGRKSRSRLRRRLQAPRPARPGPRGGAGGGGHARPTSRRPRSTDAIAADLAAPGRRLARTAHRPGLPEQPPGARAPARTWRSTARPGRCRTATASPRPPSRSTGTAGTIRCPGEVRVPFAAGRDGPLPRRRPAPPAPCGTRCTTSAAGRSVTHPPRRAAAGRAARAPADAGGPRQAAGAGRGRAQPGPRRPLAGRPRPLRRRAQEPLRPAPLRGRP